MKGFPGRWMRPAAGLLVASALVAIGVTINALTVSGTPLRSGPLRISGPLKGSPGPYVRGSGFYASGGGRAALADSVFAPLVGGLSPVAVPSPDGRYLAYNSWRPARPVDQGRSFSQQGIRPGDLLGTPSVRLYDTVSGKDTLLENGGTSVAWRGDGAIADVRGSEPGFRAGSDYTGQIVVHGSVRGPAQRWSVDAARYVVYGWAANRLIAYRIGQGEQIETVVLDGPGRVRSLADGPVVALSPDGESALVTSADGQSVRLLRVADGAETATLDVASSGAGVSRVGYSGSWTGDVAAAPADAGIVLFRMREGSIAVEQVLGLDPGQFPAGVESPELVGDSGDEIVAVAERPPANGDPALNVLLDCDRVTRTCRQGDAAPATDWVRVVRDPSRPKKGGR
jgi:hypothetical protein